MMAILLVTGSLHAAEQPMALFVDVQQIVFLKKGESKKNQIVISDPGKIKQLLDVLTLEKSERLFCDMSWKVTFVTKTGRVQTAVCKHCVQISNKKGTERFKTPPEFYKLVEQVENWK
jgi:hypothetical protein